ncbi:PAS domain S-box protein [Telluribacter sp. SYSU D00476]|uniref:PAS domain S-box protein n=1 Tax=Telluribacter sp. SYSU D00476 TaxID=2811430 RepID=UPI001FF5895D|nr:PAS domain S-box protein [Telluribacter sp. SYSU D00476]
MIGIPGHEVPGKWVGDAYPATALGSSEQWPQSLRTTLSIVESSVLPMVLFWGIDALVFYNEAFRNLSAFDQTGLPPRGSSAYSTWPDVVPLIKHILLSGTDPSTTTDLLPADSPLQVEQWHPSCSPVMDETGRPGGILVTYVQTGLAPDAPHSSPPASQNQHKLILDQLQACIILLDHTGRITYANDQHCCFQPKGDITGYNYLDLCRQSGETAAGGIAEGIEKVIRGKLSIFALDYHCQSSARPHWFRVKAIPLLTEEAPPSVLVTHLDITDRKLTELQTQKALQENQKILDASLDVICTFDDKGRFIQASSACRMVWGYEPEELIGKYFMDMVVPEDHPKTMEAFNWVIDNNYLRNFENRYIRKDGTTVPIVWTATWDIEEGVLFCIGRDDTEKKKVEEQLTINNQKITNILESITDGFFTLDKDWKITYWNHEAEHILGVSRAEAMGRNLWEMYQEAIPLRFYTEYHRALVEQVSVHFVEYLPSIGAWLDVSCYPTEDGLTLYFRNVTARKLAEEQIRIAKERYDLVAKATHDAIWEWDPMDGKIHWGDGYKTLFGYDIAEKIYDTDSWLAHIHPDDSKAVMESIHQSIRSSQATQWRNVYRLVRAEGSYATVLDRGFLIRGNDGTPIRMIGSIQDISLQKEAEKEREELIRQLTQKNHDQEQFAYITSHNLRAPLSNLLGLLSLVDCIPTENAELDEILKGFRASTMALNNTVNDLINILIIKGKPVQNRELISLRSIYDKVCQQLNMSMEEVGACIIFDDSEVPAVVFDKLYLESIFMNLLSNSIKYRSFNRRLSISISTKNEGDSVRLIFSDNGIGIDLARYRERLFGFNQRFHDRPDSKGFGLYLVKSQVESMGGSIEVESQVEVGTTFTITIQK